MPLQEKLSAWGRKLIGRGRPDISSQSPITPSPLPNLDHGTEVAVEPTLAIVSTAPTITVNRGLAITYINTRVQEIYHDRLLSAQDQPAAIQELSEDPLFRRLNPDEITQLTRTADHICSYKAAEVLADRLGSEPTQSMVKVLSEWERQIEIDNIPLNGSQRPPSEDKPTPLQESPYDPVERTQEKVVPKKYGIRRTQRVLGKADSIVAETEESANKACLDFFDGEKNRKLAAALELILDTLTRDPFNKAYTNVLTDKRIRLGIDVSLPARTVVTRRIPGITDIRIWNHLRVVYGVTEDNGQPIVVINRIFGNHPDYDHYTRTRTRI